MGFASSRIASKAVVANDCMVRAVTATGVADQFSMDKICVSWGVATGYHDLNKMPPDRMHEELDILCSELSLYPNTYLLFLISCTLKQKYNEIKLRRLLMFLMSTRNPFLLRFYVFATFFLPKLTQNSFCQNACLIIIR